MTDLLRKREGEISLLVGENKQIMMRYVQLESLCAHVSFKRLISVQRQKTIDDLKEHYAAELLEKNKQIQLTQEQAITNMKQARHQQKENLNFNF